MKLNLGCGTNIVDGWENIDASYNARLAKYPYVRQMLYKVGILSYSQYNTGWDSIIDQIETYDLTKGLQYPDNCVNYIYSSHMIEHMALSDFEYLCKECERVMKPGGWLRFSTPDLSIYINKYESEYNAIDFIQKTGLGEETSNSLFSTIYEHYFKYNHKWLHDYKSLQNILKSYGFVNVNNREFKEGEVPDINKLDNRPENSLYVEAQKPDRK